jgi:hypothetical protein
MPLLLVARMANAKSAWLIPPWFNSLFSGLTKFRECPNISFVLEHRFSPFLIVYYAFVQTFAAAPIALDSNP